MPATFSKQELSSSPLGNGGPYQNAYLEKKKILGTEHFTMILKQFSFLRGHDVV